MTAFLFIYPVIIAQHLFWFVRVRVLSCVRLFHDLKYCNPPGSSVHGIFQARIVEWVAISYSRGSSQHRGGTHVSCISCIGRWILYHWHHLLCQQSIFR